MGTKDCGRLHYLREEGCDLWEYYGLKLGIEPGTGEGEVGEPVAAELVLATYVLAV